MEPSPTLFLSTTHIHFHIYYVISVTTGMMGVGGRIKSIILSYPICHEAANSKQFHSQSSLLVVICFAYRENANSFWYQQEGGCQEWIQQEKSLHNCRYLKANRYSFLDYLSWISVLVIAQLDPFLFPFLHVTSEYMFIVYTALVNSNNNAYFIFPNSL